MARLGSRTRKYSTALTLIETLSRVITSWGGTSIATTRRSTRTILSMTGISRMSPGPLAPMTRPSRKITPRSYSFRILMALYRNRITMTSSAKYGIIPFLLPGFRGEPLSAARIPGLDEERHPFAAGDDHLVPLLQGDGAPGIPPFSQDE